MQVNATRGFVSAKTMRFEHAEARKFWMNGEIVRRSVHVEDEAHWRRVWALLAKREPTDDSAARAELDKHPGSFAPDADEIAAARAVKIHHRKARSDFKVGRGIHPFPVYVARYENGEILRLSFWSHANKPLDFAAGYNVATTIGRAKPISGHVEMSGQVLSDPFFETVSDAPVKARKDSPAKRLAAICKALNEGEIEAALLMARAE